MDKKYLTYVLSDFSTLVNTIFNIYQHEGHSKKEILSMIDKKFKDIKEKMS